VIPIKIYFRDFIILIDLIIMIPIRSKTKPKK